MDDARDPLKASSTAPTEKSAAGVTAFLLRVWRRWFPPQPLERIMPTTLMARVSLTILIPLILVQATSTYVFYDNHLTAVSQRIEQDLAGDLAAVVAAFIDQREPDQ